MNILRTALLFLSLTMFCVACAGSQPLVYIGGGPIPPYVSVVPASFTSEYKGALPLKISVYIDSYEIEEGSLSIDWGDGGGWSADTTPEGLSTYTHTYSQEGSFLIRVKAVANGKLLEDSTTVIITEQEPA